MSKRKVSQEDINVHVTAYEESKLQYIPGGYLSLEHIKELARARLASLKALNDAGRLIDADVDTFSYRPPSSKIKWPR